MYISVTVKGRSFKMECCQHFVKKTLSGNELMPSLHPEFQKVSVNMYFNFFLSGNLIHSTGLC